MLRVEGLNGGHLWVCEGTRFPHAPLWSGVYGFCGFAAKTIHPTRMGWHALACMFALRKQSPPQVTPVEGLRVEEFSMGFMRMGGGPTSEPLLARSCVRCRYLQ